MNTELNKINILKRSFKDLDEGIVATLLGIATTNWLSSNHEILTNKGWVKVLFYYKHLKSSSPFFSFEPLVLNQKFKGKEEVEVIEYLNQFLKYYEVSNSDIEDEESLYSLVGDLIKISTLKEFDKRTTEDTTLFRFKPKEGYLIVREEVLDERDLDLISLIKY